MSVDIRTSIPVVRADEILTPAALDFVGLLHREFAGRRAEIVRERAERRAEVARTKTLDFAAETAAIRADRDWRVAEIPADLRDRRVEITGPTDRKIAINALNSGASVWLADLEDANTPHWVNVIGGQVTLYDATRRRLAYTAPDGREYRLRDDVKPPVVIARPRGWHLDEHHLGIDGVPAIGALVDFGLHFFHNARALLESGSGPYYYLPKLEGYREARLWNGVFTLAERELGIPYGTVRATVLIETIPAAFEMDEILYELRDHICGLNAGRWDYLFSIIKYFRDAGSSYVLPDRNAITMTAPFMRAYTELLVRTCHSRGAMAIGGMAAFIPSRRDPAANEVALTKVREDKTREADDGFDGSWVAHPDLVALCREIFTEKLGDRPNQLDRLREDVSVTASELLDIPSAAAQFTEDGLRNNVSVALRYIAAWLGGTGAVAINNLMEDAATAEICRTQVWQWISNATVLDTGRTVDAAFVDQVIREELAVMGAVPGIADAERILRDLIRQETFTDFLTVPAHDVALRTESAR